jgi:hypothetical protein
MIDWGALKRRISKNTLSMYFLRALIANLTCRTNQQRLSSLGALKEQQPEKPSAANNRWAIRRKAGTVRCRGHRPLIKAVLVNYFFFCGSYPPPSTRRELFGSRFAYLSCLGTSVYYPLPGLRDDFDATVDDRPLRGV